MPSAVRVWVAAAVCVGGAGLALVAGAGAASSSPGSVSPDSVGTTSTSTTTTTPVTSLTIVSGSGQTVAVGSGYAPLVVRVVDGSSNPVAGDLVTCTAPSSGPSLTFSRTSTNTENDPTNASGVATTSTPIANGIPGSFHRDLHGKRHRRVLAHERRGEPAFTG
ncbi:MAG TPA: hypothetical protein VI462_12500 [Acidimicrobiia bacterium]